MSCAATTQVSQRPGRARVSGPAASADRRQALLAAVRASLDVHDVRARGPDRGGRRGGRQGANREAGRDHGRRDRRAEPVGEEAVRAVRHGHHPSPSGAPQRPPVTRLAPASAVSPVIARLRDQGYPHGDRACGPCQCASAASLSAAWLPHKASAITLQARWLCQAERQESDRKGCRHAHGRREHG